MERLESTVLKLPDGMGGWLHLKVLSGSKGTIDDPYTPATHSTLVDGWFEHTRKDDEILEHINSIQSTLEEMKSELGGRITAIEDDLNPKDHDKPGWHDAQRTVVKVDAIERKIIRWGIGLGALTQSHWLENLSKIVGAQ